MAHISTRTLLPLDVLASFVRIVECGSMLRASELEGVSQSALSLRIGRLEAILQRKLFSRQGARLALLPAGEILLDHAKRMIDLNDRAVAEMSVGEVDAHIRIGIVQDFADRLLSDVLARFSAIYAQTTLEVLVGNTQDMLAAVEAGRLDIAVGLGAADDPRVVKRAPMYWIGAPTLLSETQIPLALFEAPCRFRTAAMETLERAGIPYRIAVQASDMGSLRAAVEAGIGVTCRTGLFGGEAAGRQLDLPPLPLVSCIVAQADSLGRAGGELASLVRERLANVELAPFAARSGMKAL